MVAIKVPLRLIRYSTVVGSRDGAHDTILIWSFCEAKVLLHDVPVMEAIGLGAKSVTDANEVPRSLFTRKSFHPA